MPLLPRYDEHGTVIGVVHAPAPPPYTIVSKVRDPAGNVAVRYVDGRGTYGRVVVSYRADARGDTETLILAALAARTSRGLLP